MRFTTTLLLTTLALSGSPCVQGLLRDIDSSVDGLLHQESNKESAFKESTASSFREPSPRETANRDADRNVQRRRVQNADYRLSTGSRKLYSIPSTSGSFDGDASGSPFSKGFQTNPPNVHRINTDPNAIKPYTLQGRTIRNADYHTHNKEVPGSSSAAKYTYSSPQYQNPRPADNDRYEKQDERDGGRPKKTIETRDFDIVHAISEHGATWKGQPATRIDGFGN